MRLIQLHIAVAVVALSLLSACQRQPDKDTTTAPKPFWQAKPSIPYEPSNFCMITERLMTALPASSNFRCQENLSGGLGARVDVSNVQIVLLQGAKSEWFMFAYELHEGTGPAIGDQVLQLLQRDIERSFKTPDQITVNSGDRELR